MSNSNTVISTQIGWTCSYGFECRMAISCVVNRVCHGNHKYERYDAKQLYNGVIETTRPDLYIDSTTNINSNNT